MMETEKNIETPEAATFVFRDGRRYTVPMGGSIVIPGAGGGGGSGKNQTSEADDAQEPEEWRDGKCVIITYP